MKIGVVVCAIAASAFIGPSAWAALVVLDQEQPYKDYSYNIAETTVMAQTFTAGLSGTLDHIEFGTPNYGFDTEGRHVGEIFEGQPGAWTDLGSVNLSAFDESGNHWISAYPTTSISVTADTMYALQLSAESGVAQVGVTATPLYGGKYPDYVRGELWTYISSSSIWYDDPGIYDMQFRTYVQVVPLPAGVWLGMCAVGFAGWHLKRLRA